MTTPTTPTGPTRRRDALPSSGRWPRVGKIRLGTAELNAAKTAELGRDIFTPRKADHFVVRVDESGITSEEAAAAFAAAYPGEPTMIRFILPGDTPDDNMEGAWRFYGANKLKRRCDGEMCSERTPTGGWQDIPCVCKERNIAPDSRDHCTLTYTISLILPDVAVPGIWQLDTGSEISSRRMAEWLDMIYGLRGSCRLIEGDLALVPQKVQPVGMTKTTTVYVLNPQARGATVDQLLAGGGGYEIGPGNGAPVRAEIPPPAADEVPEPTLDRTAHTEPAPDDAAEPATGAPGAGDNPPAAEPWEGVVDQIKAMSKDDKARLKARALTWRAPITEGGEPTPIAQTYQSIARYIAHHWPGQAVDGLLDALDLIDEQAGGDGAGGAAQDDAPETLL
jgi:hypothetical protein